MTNNNSLLQSLSNIGLSDTEAILYLTGLELGPTTILNLSKFSNIKRTTIYSVIDNLVTKGIFEIQLDGWKKLYCASSPKNLERLIFNNYQSLLTIIPKLEAMNSEDNQTYLISHTGIDNIKNLYLKILDKLEENSDYLIIGNMNMWGEQMGEFGEEFFVNRQEICKSKNIIIKALFVKDRYAKLQEQRQNLLGMQVKFLPAGTRLQTNYVITNSIAVFHQIANGAVAFETNNPYIIETQKELFGMLWGKKLNKL